MKALPTGHNDVRISQGEAPLTASCEALHEKSWIIHIRSFQENHLHNIHIFSILSTMVAMYRWHLVEGDVATIGTKFVSQELTR